MRPDSIAEASSVFDAPSAECSTNSEPTLTATDEMPVACDESA